MSPTLYEGFSSTLAVYVVQAGLVSFIYTSDLWILLICWVRGGMLFRVLICLGLSGRWCSAAVFFVIVFWTALSIWKSVTSFQTSGNNVLGFARPPRVLAPDFLSFRALDPLSMKCKPRFTISQYTASSNSGTFCISSAITSVPSGLANKASRKESGLRLKALRTESISRS